MWKEQACFGVQSCQSSCWINRKGTPVWCWINSGRWPEKDSDDKYGNNFRRMNWYPIPNARGLPPSSRMQRMLCRRTLWKTITGSMDYLCQMAKAKERIITNYPRNTLKLKIVRLNIGPLTIELSGVTEQEIPVNSRLFSTINPLPKKRTGTIHSILSTVCLCRPTTGRSHSNATTS